MRQRNFDVTCPSTVHPPIALRERRGLYRIRPFFSTKREKRGCMLYGTPLKSESFTAILVGLVNWNTACVHYEINCALDH
jgi:hypothetical protein